MGADSLANFTKHTELSPAVQPFTRAARIRIVDEPTIIAGTPTRGPMATVGVDVFIAPSFRHASGYEKESDAPEALRFAIRLQQERRPPKNWLITEIADTRWATRATPGTRATTRAGKDECMYTGLGGGMDPQRHRRGAFFSSTIRSEMPE